LQERRGVSIEVVAERVRGLRTDLDELRQAHREDHHRLRTLEASVQKLVDVAAAQREEARDNAAKIANAIQLGGLIMAVALVALSVVTVVLH